MLAVMEASQAAGPANKTTEPPPPVTPTPEQGSEKGVVLSHDDFLQSGRTGRRNALADIMGINAAVTSSDLPSRLESLTTKDKSETKVNEPGSSKS